MELIIVIIFMVLVYGYVIFISLRDRPSNKNDVGREYKPIDMPMYTQSTYSKEIGVQPAPVDKSVLSVPDNIAKEVFTRGDIKPKKSTKTNSRRNNSKADDSKPSQNRVVTDDNQVPSTTHVDIESYGLSCSPSVSYKQSCASPVESSSGSIGAEASSFSSMTDY